MRPQQNSTSRRLVTQAKPLNDWREICAKIYQKDYKGMKGMQNLAIITQSAWHTYIEKEQIAIVL